MNLFKNELLRNLKESIFKKDRNRDIDFYVGDKVLIGKITIKKCYEWRSGTILRSRRHLIIEFDSVEKGTREVEFEGLESFN